MKDILLLLLYATENSMKRYEDIDESSIEVIDFIYMGATDGYLSAIIRNGFKNLITHKLMFAKREKSRSNICCHTFFQLTCCLNMRYIHLKNIYQYYLNSLLSE